MFSSLSTRFSNNEKLLSWVTALLAALLAAWVILQAHGTINSDGILYVEVARLFAAGEWRQGFALYNWPLYPLLIAIVHDISGFELQASAHVLGILFFALTSGGLVVLVRETGGGQRQMAAAAILLFASTYMVKSILPMVVREHGFWAAHVWSLVFFLRFYRSGSWTDAFLWGAAGILSLLFRIEGTTFLLLLPVALLLQKEIPWRARFASLVKANVLLLFGIIGVLALLVLHPSLQFSDLGRLRDPLSVTLGVYDQVVQGLAAKSQIYAEKILGKLLDDYAMPGLLLTLAYALLTKACSSAGWLQFLLAAYSLKSRATFPLPKYSAVFGWLVLLGIGNAVFIILGVFVLPKRYLLPIAFVILVYAAFGLAALYGAWQHKPKFPLVGNWLFPVTMIAIALQMAIVLWPANPGRAYELEAARWLHAHTAAGSRIYYDVRRVRYYVNQDSADRTQDDWATVQQRFSPKEMLQYDYMLVHVSRKTPERERFLVERVGAPPVAIFDNGRGDRVLIFRTNR